MLKSQILVGDLCSNHRSSLEIYVQIIDPRWRIYGQIIDPCWRIYVQIIDPRWRSMFKSNRSFMSISKRGSELCSQLVLWLLCQHQHFLPYIHRWGRKILDPEVSEYSSTRCRWTGEKNMFILWGNIHVMGYHLMPWNSHSVTSFLTKFRYKQLLKSHLIKNFKTSTGRISNWNIILKVCLSTEFPDHHQHWWSNTIVLIHLMARRAPSNTMPTNALMIHW